MPQLVDARYVRDHIVWVRFADGLEGEVDLAGELEGPIFEPLKDPAFFRRVRFDSEIRTVVWPNGADLAPEFLYSRVRVPA